MNSQVAVLYKPQDLRVCDARQAIRAILDNFRYLDNSTKDTFKQRLKKLFSNLDPLGKALIQAEICNTDMDFFDKRSLNAAIDEIVATMSASDQRLFSQDAHSELSRLCGALAGLDRAKTQLADANADYNKIQGRINRYADIGTGAGGAGGMVGGAAYGASIGSTVPLVGTVGGGLLGGALGLIVGGGSGRVAGNVIGELMHDKSVARTAITNAKTNLAQIQAGIEQQSITRQSLKEC